MENLNVDKEYSSYAEFLVAKEAYQVASNSVLVVNDSMKLKGDGEFVKVMVYQRFELRCKAGKERPSSSKGLRNSSTYKKNCSVKVKK